MNNWRYWHFEVLRVIFPLFGSGYFGTALRSCKDNWTKGLQQINFLGQATKERASQRDSDFCGVLFIDALGQLLTRIIQAEGHIGNSISGPWSLFSHHIHSYWRFFDILIKIGWYWLFFRNTKKCPSSQTQENDITFPQKVILQQYVLIWGDEIPNLNENIAWHFLGEAAKYYILGRLFPLRQNHFAKKNLAERGGGYHQEWNRFMYHVSWQLWY